jgi:hypothetical protein
MAQLAVVMLALFAEMERTYAAERPPTPGPWPQSTVGAPAGLPWWIPTSSNTL